MNAAACFFEEAKIRFPLIAWIVAGAFGSSAGIGIRILKLTGKRRNRVHDVLEDQEKLEDRAIVPTHVLAKEGAFITLNLLFCIYTTFAAPLAFVGLGWLGGPIAWKMFFWVGFCWFPTLLVAGVNQKNRETSVKIMKHRFVSLVRFKSEKFGHG